MTKFSQHFFRRETHNLTALSLSCLCIVAITPFAIYRTIAGDWPIATIDWLIITSQIACFYISYRHQSRHFPGIMVALMFSTGAIASLYTGGVEHLYWLYPATVSSYFLTDYIKGAAIASTTIAIAALTCLIPSLDFKHTVIVLFTLLATNGFGFIFAFMAARRDNELSSLARIDSLTGINNRRALNEALDAITSGRGINNELCFLGIIDLDNFKQINDQYGHMIGDEILSEASKTLVNAVDHPENLYRYGGDEFVYITAHKDVETVKYFFESFKKNLAVGPNSSIMKQVTLSVGLAEYHPNEDATQWLQRADTALLEAKRNGKNRLQFSA